MSGADNSNIDSHIATLEEALDALKRQRYSRDFSSVTNTNSHEETRQRDEDKETALASENELLLRVLRKVMLEKEFHLPSLLTTTRGRF